jgi:Zn-dependent protease
MSNFLLAAVGILLIRTVEASAPGTLRNLKLALLGGQFASGTIAPIAYLLFYFVLVNTMLAVFNLIPIPPLDGSGVALSLAPALRGIYVAIAPFGFLILILLISTPILRNLFRPFQYLVYRLIFGA